MKCGGSHQNIAEPARCTDRRKSQAKISEDTETDVLPMSAAGKKRQLIGTSGGTPKRAAISNQCKPSSLNRFLAPMEKCTDLRLGRGNEAALLMVEAECGGRREDEPIDRCGTLVLEDSADEADLVSFKRKRSLRLRSQDQVSPVREHTTKTKAGSCRKRRRPEGSQKLGKQGREPSVILAWKQWCMYEGEDDEEIEALINKRDERRRLERQNELLRQEHEREDSEIDVSAAANSTPPAEEVQVAAEEAREEAMVDAAPQKLEIPQVTGSCASHTDKRAAVTGTLPLPTVSEDHLVQLVSGEGAEGSNTPAGVDSKLGGSLGREGISDSDIELASGDSKLGDGINPASRNVGVGDRLGENLRIQSRAGSTQVLVSSDQQTDDPTFFSAQEDSMVLDPGAEGVTVNLKNRIRTSDESISQSTLNDICMKPKAHGTEKGKAAFHEGGASCCGRHREELIVDLDDEDGTDGVEPTVEKLSVIVGDMDRVRAPGPATDGLNNQLHASLPSSSRSEQDWGQSSEPTVPGAAGGPRHEVFEEQGESTGGPIEVAYRRGKQKVIELSDEEEDSNRVSIERRVMSGQQSYFILEDAANSNGDGGAATSGAEISSVNLGARFASGASHCVPEERLALVDYENTDGGTVESNAPYQASRESEEELENPEQVRTYRRRSLRQGKAIAGQDSGEEVRGPVAGRDGESSDVDSHEGQLGGDGPAQDVDVHCPVCYKKLSPAISNAKLNAHIDKCLSRL